MADTYLDDIFKDFHKETKKHFDEVFKIETTKIGIQIKSLLPIKIGDLELNKNKAIIINDNLKINGVSILELQGKNLIGTISKDNNIFNITSFY